MARSQSINSRRPIVAPSVRLSIRVRSRTLTDRLSPERAHKQVASTKCLSIASSSSLPSFASDDSRVAALKDLGAGLDRLENERLQQQRFVPSPEKVDDLSRLALGAKVERALCRRMSSQDAVMRQDRSHDEKAVRGVVS